jgi:hypothetical protein
MRVLCGPFVTLSATESPSCIFISDKFLLQLIFSLRVWYLQANPANF